MKFSHEFASEEQALARENLLRNQGYSAWRNHKADGTWQVYWMLRS
jgi:hypothetical protein